MTTTIEDPQLRIDSYLMKLRRSLGELPPDEVNDILREIRGHILERAEAAGGLSNEKLVSILRDLGRPEDIGPLYQAEAMIARARSSFSPTLILRTTMRWAMTSVVGFFSFMAGLLGYGMALGFFFCAIAKPFNPTHVGAWVTTNGFSLGTLDNVPGAHDVLGWWIIPICLVAGALALLVTTRLLRWLLKFFPMRAPLAAA